MKILVIGCGSIGRRHIKNLLSIGMSSILAFDIDKAKLKAVKGISKSIIVSDRLKELWREKPDVAFICVPTALHIRYALEAARKGCHIFIEKPLSHNMKGMDTLIRIVKKKNLVVYIGYKLHFNKCLIKIKKLLRSERPMKDIITGRIHFGTSLPRRHPWEDYRLGYGGKKSLGGGVILDSISHQLNYLISLFGKPEKVFSYSSKGSKLDIDVEDLTYVLMKFPGNTLVSAHSNYIEWPHKNTFELIGEGGTIFCDFAKGYVKYYNIRKGKWIVFYGDKDTNEQYVKEIKDFIKCMKRKSVPASMDVISGRNEMKILMGIKKSTDKGKWIKV